MTTVRKKGGILVEKYEAYKRHRSVRSGIKILRGQISDQIIKVITEDGLSDYELYKLTNFTSDQFRKYRKTPDKIFSLESLISIAICIGIHPELTINDSDKNVVFRLRDLSEEV